MPTNPDQTVGALLGKFGQSPNLTWSQARSLYDFGYSPAQIRTALSSAGVSSSEISSFLNGHATTGAIVNQVKNWQAPSLAEAIGVLGAGGIAAAGTSFGAAAGGEAAAASGATGGGIAGGLASTATKLAGSSLLKDATIGGILGGLLTWGPVRMLELVIGVALLFLGLKTLTGASGPSIARVAV